MVNKDELFIELKKKLDGLKESFEFWHKQIIINYLHVFTKDKYILLNDGSIKRAIEIEKDKLYTRIPKLLPIYRAIFSKIIKSNPLFSVEQNRTNWEDETGADVAEALVNKLYTDIKRKGILNQLGMWFIISGNWFSKVVYQNKYCEEFDFDEEGDFYVKNIIPFNLFFPNNYEYSDITKCPYVFENILLDRKFAEKKYNIEEKEGAISNELKYKIMLTGDIIDIDKSINTDEYCELTIYTEKKNMVNPKGYYVLMSDRRILEVRENPFPDTIGHPYAQAKMLEIGLTRGETSISYSTQIDKEINMRRGQLAEHSKKLANPILQLPMRSMLEKDKLGRPDTKIIYVDERYGEAKFIQPAEFSQYFHLNLQEFETDLNDINAIHDPTKAKRPSGVRSALMLAFLAEQDDAQHSPVIDNFFVGLENLVFKYLEMKKEFFGDVKEDIEIFGENNVIFTQFEGKQLKNNTNIRVDVVSGLPMNKIARQQVLMELAKTGIISPSMVRKLLGFGELEPVFKMNKRSRLKQYIEIQKLIRGEPVSIDINDNHIEHISVLVEYSRGNNFDKLDDEKKSLYWSHATGHITAMLELFENAPLLAYFVINFSNLDPDIKEFITAEIQKSVANKQAEAQAKMQSQEPQPPPTPEETPQEIVPPNETI